MGKRNRAIPCCSTPIAKLGKECGWKRGNNKAVENVGVRFDFAVAVSIHRWSVTQTLPLTLCAVTGKKLAAVGDPEVAQASEERCSINRYPCCVAWRCVSRQGLDVG